MKINVLFAIRLLKMFRNWLADISFAKNASKNGSKDRGVALYAEILKKRAQQQKLPKLLDITVC